MSKFDDLKILGLYCVTSSAFIDPAKMSKRIKTSVKKMLREGCCVGGENAEAKMLAQRIMETYDIPHVRYNGRSTLHIVAKHMLIAKVRDKLEELINADDVAQSLQGNRYFRAELPQFKFRLEDALEEDKNKEVYCWVYEENIAAQARSIFKEHNATNFEANNIVNHFIAMIDNNSPIAIKVWRNK